MIHNININEKTLEAISTFVGIDEKEEILQQIDRVIELCIKSKIAEEYQMSDELGTLFDVKCLIESLPFKQMQESA